MSGNDRFCTKSQNLRDLLAIADMGFWDASPTDPDRRNAIQVGKAELARLYEELQAEAIGNPEKEKLIKTVRRPLKKSNYSRAATALSAASRILDVCDVQPSFEMFYQSRSYLPPYVEKERLAMKKKLLGHLFEEDNESLISEI
ncbi:hypothetical protein LCGC14_0621320 [marine sediment metagenome]|uniref:Uncharacterized protein n=1 Tax=marine sediment metagenome TaxID=412755 RepID=A0A0F9R4S1_9ZZZZ